MKCGRGRMQAECKLLVGAQCRYRYQQDVGVAGVVGTEYRCGRD